MQTYEIDPIHDWDNPGLIKFKDRWGADRSTLTYWRYGELPRVGEIGASALPAISSSIFRRAHWAHRDLALSAFRLMLLRAYRQLLRSRANILLKMFV